MSGKWPTKSFDGRRGAWPATPSFSEPIKNSIFYQIFDFPEEKKSKGKFLYIYMPKVGS